MLKQLRRLQFQPEQTFNDIIKQNFFLYVSQMYNDSYHTENVIHTHTCKENQKEKQSHRRQQHHKQVRDSNV